MTVKIVTDSGSDIPKEVAQALDITVVPLYVQFGSQTFRDGVDITPDEFYTRLERDNIAPTTSAASPGDFAATYNRLCRDADNIVSIHLSSKVSATFEAARQAKEMVGDSCRIEVVDSRYVSVGLALVTITAARAAQAGQNIHDILEQVSRVIPSIKVIGLLDTLKYVARGGRLGRVGPLLSSVLPVKPLLTMKDGLLSPVGVARTRSKGIERIYDMVKSAVNIKDITIAHSSMEAEIRTVVEKLKALAPGVTPMIAKLGPALGAHGGPGSILLAVQQEITSDTDTEAKLKKPLITLPSLQSIRENLSQRMQRDTRSFEYALNRVQV
jgi:DegV family protein with EDD domain